MASPQTKVYSPHYNPLGYAELTFTMTLNHVPPNFLGRNRRCLLQGDALSMNPQESLHIVPISNHALSIPSTHRTQILPLHMPQYGPPVFDPSMSNPI
jgi:hypothetical protein